MSFSGPFVASQLVLSFSSLASNFTRFVHHELISSLVSHWFQGKILPMGTTKISWSFMQLPKLYADVEQLYTGRDKTRNSKKKYHHVVLLDKFSQYIQNQSNSCKYIVSMLEQ